CRCFFFSSRRRHTRLVSDWSSDVCSSDLPPLDLPTDRPRGEVRTYAARRLSRTAPEGVLDGLKRVARGAGATLFMVELAAFALQIGRASCRERGEVAGVGAAFQKKSGIRS